MEKEYLISLIKKMELNNVENIESILLKDEKVLYALYNMNGDFFKYGVSIVNSNYKSTSDILKAINILGNTDINNRLKVVNILTNNSLIERDLVFTFTKIIIDYKDSPCKRYLYEYMINTYNIVKDKNTILSELKLLTECKGELNAKYVYKVLLNENEKIKSIAIDIINLLKVVEHIPSLEAMYDIVCDDIAIENGTVLEGIKFISTIKNSRYISELAASAYTEYDLIKADLYKEVAKVVSEFNDDDLAELAFNTMITKSVIDGNVVIESGIFIKKIEDYKYSEYIYTILTNKKLIEEGLSLEVAHQILNSPNVFNAGYIEKYATYHNINSLIVIEGCELINKIKNRDTAKFMFYALTNKSLNDNNTELECAYVISKNDNKLKHIFINQFVLSDKDIASNKDIAKLLEEIYKSNILFKKFKTKIEGNKTKLIEFGTIIINYNHNIKMISLIGLFDVMKKLTNEEIELIKNKYRGFGISNIIFRHNFDKIVSTASSSDDIIKLIKDITGTTIYDKKEENIEIIPLIEKETIQSNIKTNNDARILLDILSRETETEIKTDVLVKKLVRVRENNTMNK